MRRAVANRIKDLRTRRGWTQQELADAVGVSRQSINSIERQRNEPSLALALMFARVFGLATEKIFHLKKKKNETQAPRMRKALMAPIASARSK